MNVPEIRNPERSEQSMIRAHCLRRYKINQVIMYSPDHYLAAEMTARIIDPMEFYSRVTAYIRQLKVVFFIESKVLKRFCGQQVKFESVLLDITKIIINRMLHSRK